MTARSLISLASLMPGQRLTPSGRDPRASTPLSIAPATPAPIPANDPTIKEPSMPRRTGIRQKTFDLIAATPGITMEQLHHALGGTAQQLHSTIWALKKIGEICRTGEKRHYHYFPGKKPPKTTPPLRGVAPMPADSESPGETTFYPPAGGAPASTFQIVSRPGGAPIQIHQGPDTLEVLRTASGEVLVIAGDTIAARIPAAIAEAIRNSEHL